MIKDKTAVQVWFDFEKEKEREPLLKEFMELGYSKTTYYNTRKRVKEIKRGNNEEGES